MRKILKFPLYGLGPCEIRVCGYLQTLSVGWQNGSLMLWAEVTATKAAFTYGFNVFGTGWEVPEDYEGTFVNTVQGTDGYVYHVYKD
jgi:hypothetical protein